MEDLNNRTKGLFVQAFKNGNSPYGNITINELVDIFQKQLDTDERLKKEAEESVIKKYTNKYFKKYENDDLFGKTLEVFKIDELKASGYNCDYDRMYHLKGGRININKSNLYFREFDSSVHSSYSEKELNTYTEITEEEYNQYFSEYEQIYNQLNKLIKNK